MVKNTRKKWSKRPGKIMVKKTKKRVKYTDIKLIPSRTDSCVTSSCYSEETLIKSIQILD